MMSPDNSEDDEDDDDLRFRKPRLLHDLSRDAGRVYYSLCPRRGSLRLELDISEWLGIGRSRRRTVRCIPTAHS